MNQIAYKTNYNWTNYPQIIDLLARLNKSTTEKMEPAYQYLVKTLIGDVEEFIYQGVKTKTFNANNINYVLTGLNSITNLNVLPNNLRGIYGLALSSGEIQINPRLSGSATLTERERQRLYMFHELGHKVLKIYDSKISLDFNDTFYGTIMNKDPNFNNPSYQTKNPIVDYGWLLIEEALVQDMAEKFTYSSKNAPRPIKQNRRDERVFGAYEFPTNYDYYGLFQPITIMFGKPLRGVGNLNDASDDKIMNDLLAKSLSGTFVNDVIAEYGVNSSLYKDLYDTLFCMGHIMNAKYASFGCPLENTRTTVENNVSMINVVDQLTKKNADYRPQIRYDAVKFIESRTATK